MLVNSHGAKIKPATVKWPRPGHGANAIAVLNGAVICSQWGNGWELLISLTGSQMKITGPIMVWAVISGFTLLHAKDLGYFFFSSIPHGSVIASSGGLIRHFGGLYSFVNTRH